MVGMPIRPSDSVAPAAGRPAGLASGTHVPAGVRQLGLAALTGGIALVVAWFALDLSLEAMSMRWASGATGDQMLHYIVSASAIDHSLFTPNLRLGFPENQNLFFAPMYDPASAVALSAGSLVISDPVLLLNVYQLGGFFVTGVAGYLMFRALRVRELTSVVFGAVFALAPFHFERVELGHAFVANYWGVAVLVVLVLVAGGDGADPIAKWADASQSPKGPVVRRLVAILIMTFALSLTNSYYYVFAAIIIAGVIVVRGVVLLVARRGVRSLLWPVVTLGSLVVFVGVQLAILSLNFGDRYQKYFSERLPLESEQHAGKITTLLLPWPGSGIPGVSSRVEAYAQYTSVSPYAEPTGMSVLAILGIALLVIWALGRFVLPSTTAGRPAATVLTDTRLSVLALAFWIGLLFYVVGGLGYLFAVLVTPEIRSWVRLSIVLATIGLAFLAVLIDATARRLWSLLAVLGVVVVIAAVDQVAGVPRAVDLQPTSDADLRALVAQADSELERDCGVAQLPVKGFPESGPILGLGDYELGLPYVVGADSTLRWSYGGVSGTHSGDFWKDADDPSSFARAVSESGACAIYVDRAAFESDGEWEAYVDAVYGDDWTFIGNPDGRQVIVAP